jgi:TetR/AcrR family transcriptional regulator, regulator of autoinduction and epiphytic fitness
VGETSVTDRRAARANRTRDSVVDALLELIDEGNMRPTAREIAARARVSLRSVYVHFDDVDALFHAAAMRHGERMEAVRGELVTEGTFEERLVAFVDRRSRIYEVGSKVTKAALLLEPFSPAMRSILDQVRRTGWAELEQVFADEVGRPLSASDRAALDVATNGKTWDALRHHHGLSVDEAKDLVRTMVRGLVHALAARRQGDAGSSADADGDPAPEPAEQGGNTPRGEGASLM